jgi:hypothetical protein
MDKVTLGAAAIVDIWMGGARWRWRLEDSEFLSSADWLMAVRLATAVLKATVK